MISKELEGFLDFLIDLGFIYTDFPFDIEPKEEISRLLELKGNLNMGCSLYVGNVPELAIDVFNSIKYKQIEENGETEFIDISFLRLNSKFLKITMDDVSDVNIRDAIIEKINELKSEYLDGVTTINW